MPPKNKKAKKDRKVSDKDVNDDDQDNDVNDNDQDDQDQDDQDDQDQDDIDNQDNDIDDQDNDNDDMPTLEYVSESKRERYKFQPVLETQLVVVKPEDRCMPESMSIFELCEAISIRARQIELGGRVFTDTTDITSPILMAKKEILDKRCPLTVVRHRTDKVVEFWHINELSIPPDYINLN